MKDFDNMIKDHKVENYEALVSYDLMALNLSVLKTRQLSSYENIKCDAIKLFKLCVQKTYFVFTKKLCIQFNGLAIDASTSGFGWNIYGKVRHKSSQYIH